MLKRSIGSLVLLSLLAACEQAPSDRTANEQATGAPTTSVKIRNEWQEKLLKLNAGDRDLTLRRAVRDDGGSCPKIKGSKYQQNYKSMAMWVAHCTSGDWAIFVAPSGDVQARRCDEIAQLNQENKRLTLPACHLWPSDPADPMAEPSWPEPAPPPSSDTP